MSGNDDRNFEDELMGKAAELPAAVSPGRDLWPGIEQVITAPLSPKRPVWTTIWAQAAAVVLLVGGSSTITYMATIDGGVTTQPAVADAPTLVFEPVSGSFGDQYNLGPDFIDARRDLAGRLDDELASLSPEARQEVITNIETIRAAIADINKALAEEPDNVLLQELLIDTYRDELSLMMKVDSISRAAMNRNDI